jgi:putative ABC transport system ATP-binding protein
MSVAENLLFGTPVGDQLKLSQIPGNDYVKTTLDRAGVEDALLTMGRRIAETMVELFADLPPGHPFFEQFSSSTRMICPSSVPSSAASRRRP